MSNYFFQSAIFRKMIVIIGLIVMLSACESTSIIKTPHIAIPENATVIDSKGKNYMVFFSPNKNKIPLNQYFDMEVQIRTPMEQVIKYPIRLAVDAGMKAHNHGMNVKPKIKNLGYGRYKITGMLLHMPGKWFLNFTIYRGALSDKAEINLFIRH